MAARKIPPEVQAIFDKYAHNNVRRMKKDDAVKMLSEEFELTPEQSGQMFESFDHDKNGVMSLWEFQQFYATIGKSAHEMVERFKELDADGSGKLDLDEAKAGLVAMGLAEKEIDFFIKTSLGEDGLIDISAFGNLLFRLKVYKQKKK